MGLTDLIYIPHSRHGSSNFSPQNQLLRPISNPTLVTLESQRETFKLSKRVDKMRFLKETFQSETGPNYYKEVPLSEILAVDTAKTHSGEEDEKRCCCWWFQSL